MRETRLSEPRLLTKQEAAQALTVCTKTVEGMVKRGELPVVSIGGMGRGVRFDVRDISAWIESKKTRAAAPAGQEAAR